MPFSKDKILIKNWFKLKVYNAMHLVSFQAQAGMSAASTSCCNSYGLLGSSTVVPAVADDAAPALISLTNWCYSKNGQARNNNYLHTLLNSTILLSTKYYQNWLMSVEELKPDHF